MVNVNSFCPPDGKAAQQGFSLIEVLVALLILSIGLLGLASLQMQSVQFNQSALYASQANFLAYEVLDRMQANAQEARDGNYNMNVGDAAPGGAGRASQDIQEILVMMQGDAGERGLLPQDGERTGLGILVTNNARVTITVAWLDARWSDDEDEQIRTYVVEGLLL